MAIALLGAFVGGASAAFDPQGYMGSVIRKDVDNNAFEVQTTHEWAHDGWLPNATTMEWLFPNEDAMNEISVDDYVEILGFPEPYDWTISLGKMKSSTDKVITDIYGDPNFLEPYWSSEPKDPPLLGNFTIEYNSTPDCSDCGICNCEADYTNITIINGIGQVVVDDYRLYPGQTCMYEGMEYRIDITFHSGEAPACPICRDTCPPGPQPTSNFTIHVWCHQCYPCHLYDMDCDCTIDFDEVMGAIQAYFQSGGISPDFDEVMGVIQLYFNSPY